MNRCWNHTLVLLSISGKISCVTMCGRVDVDGRSDVLCDVVSLACTQHDSNRAGKRKRKEAKRNGEKEQHVSHPHWLCLCVLDNHTLLSYLVRHGTRPKVNVLPHHS